MRKIGRCLRDLWTGRLPLGDAFWTYNVFWGLLLNIVGTMAGFVVLVGWKEVNPDLAAAAALTVHLLPIPYNVIVLVGVWRSAGNPGRPPWVRIAARATAVFLFAAFIFV
jgi:hypothetical protein